MNMKGQVHFEKDGPNEFQRNVHQNQCSNIGDYDIVCGSAQMCIYCDANWASSMDDCKSILGYVFLIGKW